jgi:hypothetical protein
MCAIRLSQLIDQKRKNVKPKNHRNRWFHILEHVLIWLHPISREQRSMSAASRNVTQIKMYVNNVGRKRSMKLFDGGTGPVHVRSAFCTRTGRCRGELGYP